MRLVAARTVAIAVGAALVPDRPAETERRERREHRVEERRGEREGGARVLLAADGGDGADADRLGGSHLDALEPLPFVQGRAAVGAVFGNPNRPEAAGAEVVGEADREDVFAGLGERGRDGVVAGRIPIGRRLDRRFADLLAVPKDFVRVVHPVGPEPNGFGVPPLRNDDAAAVPNDARLAGAREGSERAAAPRGLVRGGLRPRSERGLRRLRIGCEELLEPRGERRHAALVLRGPAARLGVGTLLESLAGALDFRELPRHAVAPQSPLVDPRLDAAAAPVGGHDADRNAEALAQKRPEEEAHGAANADRVARRGRFPLRAARQVAAGAVRRNGPLGVEDAKVGILERTGKFPAAGQPVELRPDDRELHVRLAAAEPDVAHRDVAQLDCGAVAVLDAHDVRPAGRKRGELRRPFAVEAGGDVLAKAVERHGHRRARGRGARDADRLAALEHHVVGVNV